MAGKAKYVKVGVTTDAKSLAGYRVLGDVVEAGTRVLLLERPEQAAPKPRAKKAAAAKPQSVGGSATAFPGSAVANG